MAVARNWAVLTRYWRLILIGVLSELIYGGYLVPAYSLVGHISQPYQDMGQMNRHSHAGFIGFVAAFAVLFVLLVLAWWEVRGVDDRRALSIVLGVGCVLGGTASFIYPVTALDILGYVDQSLVLVQYHQNPIFVPPFTFSTDPLMTMADGWATVGAPYGPLGIVLDAVPTLLAGRNVLWNVLLLKLMFSAMAVASAYLTYRVVRRFHPPAAVAAALLVAWNPLVLWEVGANGHNDAAMIFVALLALYSLAEDDLTGGAVLMLASALVKYTTLIFVPLVLVYAVARKPTLRARFTYLGYTGAWMIVITVLAYARFWEGPQTFSRSLLENQFFLYSFAYTSHNLLLPYLSSETASWIGRVLYVPVYLAALRLALRGRIESLVDALFLAIFGFLALAVNNVKYWYALAPAVFGAAVPRTPVRAAMVAMAAGMEMVVTSFNIYVWVWIGVTENNFRPINLISYIVIFVAPAAMMVWPLLMQGQFASMAGSHRLLAALSGRETVHPEGESQSQ